jgi:two-component system, NarL family, sensor histidine kinase BarA
MSYRAFKRLLGETSLERKCRFLFGAGVLLLLTLTLWLYAYLTEDLAYAQAIETCRMLVKPALMERHLPFVQAREQPGGDDRPLQETFRLIGKETEHHFMTDRFDDSYESNLFKEFSQNEGKTEDSRRRDGDRVLLYYAPVRLTSECMSCHQALAKKRDLAVPSKDAVYALARIRMPTRGIEEGVHLNRALLMATALVTAILIMIGSWLIVRYIIVKPVKHLKEVSDAISAGELNVRSEIQTGDEFEDLSHAFNRMLRNLVSMQDQWRKVNADLDRKVDELAQANMALYESNRLKSDFLATMSHELRTPLNSILGFSEVLASADGLSDKQQRWVGNIGSSGKKLLNLINDILDLAKIEAGKMHVRVEDFNLNEICDGLLSMFRPLAEKKNIDLRGRFDPAIPTLRQDMTKLQQILENLLSNAIKFTPEGGQVLLTADADARHVIFIVSDTGVGIAPEEQELVFQKFRQSGNPLTREHAGTGLGLSIVRELCKLLGGEITLHSELGRGSTFTVRLPLQLSEEPRLEFDLADERIDLSKAQRVDVRLYASAESPPVSGE